MLKEMKNGTLALSQQSLVICGIVRDCEKNLIKNILVIEELRTYFKDSHVVIFENDSIDGTKEILRHWSESYTNVHIVSETYSAEKTIPNKKDTQTNPYFSEYRIIKMAYFRNKYLEYIEANNLTSDYTVVVDMDISKFFIKGILDSFSCSDQWDVVASNCYSTSPFLIRRYHDTYALVEMSKEHLPQNEKSIFWTQYKWRFMKKKRLTQVYSAHGGFSIYKSHLMQGLRYTVIYNNDQRVKVRCEHYSLQQQIQEKKGGKIYVNKKMIVKYQTVTFGLIAKRAEHYFESWFAKNKNVKKVI